MLGYLHLLFPVHRPSRAPRFAGDHEFAVCQFGFAFIKNNGFTFYIRLFVIAVSRIVDAVTHKYHFFKRDERFIGVISREDIKIGAVFKLLIVHFQADIFPGSIAEPYILEIRVTIAFGRKARLLELSGNKICRLALPFLSGFTPLHFFGSEGFYKEPGVFRANALGVWRGIG